MSRKSTINNFLIGDVFQMSFYPNAENPEWFQAWRFPLRDSQDIAKAREIVETSGDCLGWGHQARKEKWGFRTITPPAPIAEILPPAIDHFRNSKTGALIGV